MEFIVKWYTISVKKTGKYLGENTMSWILKNAIIAAATNVVVVTSVLVDQLMDQT